MYTIETRDADRANRGAGASVPPRPSSGRRWALATAAVLLLIGLLAVAVAARDSGEPELPADDPIPTPTREEIAVDTAVRFWTAVNTGDVDTAIEMSYGDETDLGADRELWELHAAAIAAGETRTIRSCEPGWVNRLFVEVECTIVIDEPVYAFFDTTEYVNPAKVYDDGSVAWEPTIGRPYTEPNRAYAEYLRTFHPDEYAAVCDPTAYQPGSIVNDSGLALTRACGELAMPLADDVAAWLAAGRPSG